MYHSYKEEQLKPIASSLNNKSNQINVAIKPYVILLLLNNLLSYLSDEARTLVRYFTSSKKKIKPSGAAKGGPGLRGHVPTQIFIGQWHPLSIATTNKKQVVHTLAAPYVWCKSAADIEISSIITSRDPSSFDPFCLMI